jgi:DUF4097 and DUF4098 domain-containing protein YvlB
MRRPAGILAAAVALCAGAAQAQSRVEQRHPASKDALIEIDAPVGSVKVTGWDREEVLVTGTLSRAAYGVDVRGSERRLKIEVETRGNPHAAQSDLEIRVPAGCRLSVESFAARVTVGGVSGRVKAESVNGSISISGTPREVDAETVSGDIEVAGATERVRAEGTNGSVSVRNVSGSVDASSVNGRLQVVGASIDEGRLESVNGAVLFDGKVAASGSLDVESVNGAIELRLPANLGADFSLSSVGGEIASDYDVAIKPRRDRERRRHDHDQRETEVSFSVGGGGAKISVTTLNGHISLRKGSREAARDASKKE